MVTRAPTADDHARVSAAVLAAEANTSGEIVTIVADRSDAYHDVGLHYAVLAMLLVPIMFAAAPSLAQLLLVPITGGWDAGGADELFLLAFTLMTIVFLIVRYGLAWMPLRHALTPRSTSRRRVRRRAIALFRVGAQARTTGRTGILIYLSLGEHMAEIIADEAIYTLVPGELWGDAMAAMVTEVGSGRIADGMITAVEQVGAILAQQLPRHDGDRNELPDRLIEL